MHANAPADPSQTPLPLADDSFLHLTYPFSFREASNRRAGTSDLFEEVVRLIETTTLDDTGLQDDSDQQCWIPYEGKNPEYLLSHVQDFLFSEESWAGSRKNPGGSSDYTVAFELQNDAKQKLFPNNLCFCTRGDETEFDFPISPSGAWLFLFRSQVGLLVYTFELGNRVTVANAFVEEVDEELYWRKDALQSSPGNESGAEQQRQPTLADLVVLNYQISRRPRGSTDELRLCEKTTRPTEMIFSGEQSPPEWLNEKYPTVFRPFPSLHEFTEDLLGGALGPLEDADDADHRSRRAISWRPFTGIGFSPTSLG